MGTEASVPEVGSEQTVFQYPVRVFVSTEEHFLNSEGVTAIQYF